MSGEQFMNILGGIAALVVGVHFIVTRRATFTDENDEPHMWVYGWRAVAIGVVALAVSAVFFASAAKWIEWSH